LVHSYFVLCSLALSTRSAKPVWPKVSSSPPVSIIFVLFKLSFHFFLSIAKPLLQLSQIESTIICQTFCENKLWDLIFRRLNLVYVFCTLNILLNKSICVAKLKMQQITKVDATSFVQLFEEKLNSIRLMFKINFVKQTRLHYIEWKKMKLIFKKP